MDLKTGTVPGQSDRGDARQGGDSLVGGGKKVLRGGQIVSRERWTGHT